MELTQSQQKKLDDLNMYAKMWLQGKIDGDYFLEICDEIVYPDPADGPYDITSERDRTVERKEALERVRTKFAEYLKKRSNKTNEHNERK